MIQIKKLKISFQISSKSMKIAINKQLKIRIKNN